MGSKFLENLGVGSIDIGLIIFILAIVAFVLLVMSIVLIIELCKLKKRYNRFSQGRDGKSLEKEIGQMFEENRAIHDLAERNKKDIRAIYRKLEFAFQKVGLVKYDAFSQMGGKLSFALCLLNEKDNGFIINSIHGSDGGYVYLNEIKGGVSGSELGKEAEKALKIALHEE